MCEHKKFQTDFLVYVVEDDSPTTYRAEFKIKCAECGLPFEFMCGGLLNVGYVKFAPTMSPDNKELRFPIMPSTDPVDYVNAMLGEESIKKSSNE